MKFAKIQSSFYKYFETLLIVQKLVLLIYFFLLSPGCHSAFFPIEKLSVISQSNLLLNSRQKTSKTLNFL
jgi:hypothetical protein